ncbi:MAG: hypothetical protein J5786_03615 [Clostridiales bacterium]|nr:hypothetical protein [Clostridiales bacterium]
MNRKFQNIAAFMVPITLMACVGGCDEERTEVDTNEMIEESMIYDTSFEIDEDGNINLASSVRRPFKEGINYEK